jgi:hypothetical protein
VSRQTAINSLTNRDACVKFRLSVFLLKFQLYFSPLLLVITGFNTDIVYQGVTYHVQTEDKGLDTPLILSLVYDRGTILASKRSPYEDLLKLGFDEKILLDRLQKQHKVICAAIKAGRIDDLKRMTLESAAKQKNVTAKVNTVNVKEIKFEQPIGKPQKTEVSTPKAETGVVDVPKIELKTQSEIPKAEIPATKVPEPVKFEVPAVEEIKKPEVPAVEEAKALEVEVPAIKETEPPKIEMPADVWDIPIELTENEIVFDDVQIVEEVQEEVILSGEAVEIISDFTIYEPPAKETLSIELINDKVFKGGERKTLSILVVNGNTSICNASVMVKVLGSAFRPLIFHAKTDSNGVAVIHLQLPHFRNGRAAILIKAMSGGEEAELRRVIAQG